MSMLDSFFNKGFKAAKCKTLLKLTIPRIKLLRNRREIQIKQMRREIAKLLETGQEATARIRVEHIIREEKMMAAQEIIELFCELIAVRLPIIEAQKECPLDLKEAISSVCFAAPRCADLLELQQVQLSLASKYGKEFVSAATELLPECGVNRQLIELLSVRAPAPDVKLKLLKEIAEEHQLDWDPSSSESELLKPHEDLLNGPTQFVSGSKLPLPKEKHDEPVHLASEQGAEEQSDSDAGFDPSEFPEVPKASLHPSGGTASAPVMLPFPASALLDDESTQPQGSVHNLSHEQHVECAKEMLDESVAQEHGLPNILNTPPEGKQFVPFISPPVPYSASFTVAEKTPTPAPSSASFTVAEKTPMPAPYSPSFTVAEKTPMPAPSSASFTVAESTTPSSRSKTKSDTNVDLQDVLAAAEAAAETAERAAAAARSAASLAQVRINELVKKKSDVSEGFSENPFHSESFKSDSSDKPHLDHQKSVDSGSNLHSPSAYQDHSSHLDRQESILPSYDDFEVVESDSYHHVTRQESAHHQFQRLPSIGDEMYFPYLNLFKRQDSPSAFTDNSRPPHES